MDDENALVQLEAEARRAMAKDKASGVEQFSRTLQQAGLPEEAALRVTETLLSVTEIEETSGHFPPPTMLQRYKEIDPRIVDVTLDSYVNQNRHRIEMEEFATRKSFSIRSSSNIFSNLIALICIIAAVSMVGVFEYKNIDYSIFFPVVLLVVGIGGKPAAYVFSEILARSKRDD
jgi:hypothetical protein